MLEGWLEYHRATLLLTCDGLTGEQRQRRPVATSLMSLHGMVRHLADVERNWFQRVLGQRPGLPPIFLSDEASDADWGALDGADWAADLAAWAAGIEQSTVVLLGMGGSSLGPAVLEAVLDHGAGAAQRLAQQRDDRRAVGDRRIDAERRQRLQQRAPVDDLPLPGDRGQGHGRAYFR